MKKIMFFVATIALSVSAHAAKVNTLAGTYSECVKWTMPASKKFEMVYGADHSLLYRIKFFDENSTCEGEPIAVNEVSDFEVIKFRDWRSIHDLDLKEKTENIYYQITVSKDEMIVIISEKYPVQMQLDNSIVLKRQP